MNLISFKESLKNNKLRIKDNQSEDSLENIKLMKKTCLVKKDIFKGFVNKRWNGLIDFIKCNKFLIVFNLGIINIINSYIKLKIK